MKRNIALILTLLLLALPLAGCADMDYREGVALMEQGEYARALEALNALGDYGDAKALADECESAIAFENAKALMDAGDYVAAREAFGNISGYRNSREMANECLLYQDYFTALAYMKAENYPAAVSAFDSLGDFLDSPELCKECESAYACKHAGARFSLRDYRAALSLYREAGDYGNAADMALICQKRIMVQTAMQRLISIYRYNAAYSLDGILSLLAGVSGFERADELAGFVSSLASGDTAAAAREYGALKDAYITPALARVLIERFAVKKTLLDYAALALLSFDASASLCDRQRFDEYIAGDTQIDADMAAFKAFGKNTAGSADTAADTAAATATATDTFSGEGGKLIVYERDLDPVSGEYSGRILMGAYRMVSAENIPLDYSQVEYIILIDRGGSVVNSYDGGAAGVQENCRVSLVRAKDMKELARLGDFAGELPPEDYVSGTAGDAALEIDPASNTNAASGSDIDAFASASDASISDALDALDALDAPETPPATDPALEEAATATDPVAEALKAYPAYIMGASPDEKQILSAVRAAMLLLLEQREGDYGYIVTYGAIGAANGIPEKKTSPSLNGMTVGAYAQKTAEPLTAGAVLTSYHGSDFVFPRDVDGLPVTGFASGVLNAGAGGASPTNASISRLTELSLPATLRAIPSGAFYQLGRLTRIKLSAKIEYIGENAFPKGAVLSVEDNSYAHYWAVAHAWPYTLGYLPPTDESEPLKKSNAKGTVAYQNVTALAALVPWPEYATPLSESSDGRFLEFGNMDEVRYVLYVRELISSSLFESFDGFAAASDGTLTAILRAAAYTVTVSLKDGTLLVEIG